MEQKRIFLASPTTVSYTHLDSLTELQTVNKVQITVNGSQDIMYRDAIPLNKPFERDEQYILNQEE